VIPPVSETATARFKLCCPPLFNTDHKNEIFENRFEKNIKIIHLSRKQQKSPEKRVKT